MSLTLRCCSPYVYSGWRDLSQERDVSFLLISKYIMLSLLFRLYHLEPKDDKQIEKRRIVLMKKTTKKYYIIPIISLKSISTGRRGTPELYCKQVESLIPPCTNMSE